MTEPAKTFEETGLPEEARGLYEAFGDPTNPPELDPDLVPWLEEGGFLGLSLKHPLVYAVPYAPPFAKHANDMYHHKVEELARAVARKDWHTYMYLHERPYRSSAVLRLLSYYPEKVTDEAYWDLVGALWTDTENLYQWEDDIPTILGEDRPHRDHMMEPDERMALRKLGKIITIYRGYHADNDGEWSNQEGWSWTLDKDKAIWFARRMLRENETGFVVTGTVHKNRVIAHFTGRGESEIVADPADVIFAEPDEMVEADPTSEVVQELMDTDT